MNVPRRSLLVLIAAGAGVCLLVVAIYSNVAGERPQATLEQHRSGSDEPVISLPTEKEGPANQRPKVAPAALSRIPARSSQPRELVVKLDDGSEFTVPVRPLRLSSINRPEQLAGVYAELTQLARQGDASAAYSLHRWLKECRYAPADETALASAVTRVRKEGVLPLGTGETRPVQDPERAQGTLERLLAFCEGISPEQQAEAPMWLELAASSGELFALTAQANELRGSRDLLVEAYKNLWYEQGYSGALAPLAVFHKSGFIGGQPDYLQAYAFQFAEFKLVQGVYGQSGFASHRNMLLAMEDALRNTASYLTPQETAQATQLSVQLLKDNKKCCVGMLFGTTY